MESKTKNKTTTTSANNNANNNSECIESANEVTENKSSPDVVDVVDIVDLTNTWINKSNSLFIMPRRPYYELKMFVSSEYSELKQVYIDACNKHNDETLSVITGSTKYFDSGFDLFCPQEISCDKNAMTKLNHNIRCSMSRVEPSQPISVNFINGLHCLTPNEYAYPVGYYLYPRSSTGTKTPLRLANSVGIIDSGYRGDLIAAFDNNSKKKYIVEKHQRVAQVCPPDLTNPIYVIMVDSIEELGLTTRGEGGFGSTGV